MTRTALVTGAAGGIGRAVATRFAADGYRVVGVDLVDPGLTGVAHHQADVTDATEVAHAVRAATSEGDAVDVLVTCAGVTEGQPLHLTAPHEWEAVLRANLTSVFLCVREVLPGMIAAGSGTVVTVGSVLHRTAAPGLPAYAAAKGAIAALTRQLAVDYGQHGISFVTVSPGWVRTPATQSTLTGEADLERLRQSNPLGLLGRPEHIAGAVAFRGVGGRGDAERYGAGTRRGRVRRQPGQPAAGRAPGADGAAAAVTRRGGAVAGSRSLHPRGGGGRERHWPCHKRPLCWKRQATAR